MKMYINREIEIKIKPFLKRKEIISIIGPRQSGKTTFIKYLEQKLKQEGKSVKFISFEKRSDLNLFQDNIDDFKDLYEKYEYVIIDEFQYAKEGGQKLKYLYDSTNIKFIISGSSSLDLTFQTGKYMVGRMFDFKLLPFSFREFLSFKDNEIYNLVIKRVDSASIWKFDIKGNFGEEINKRLTKSLNEYIMYGGYPAVVLADSDFEKQKILESIIEKYLLQDIKGLLGLITSEELMRLCKFLSTQIGNIIKFEELCTVSGLNHQKLIQHLNILEKTFIIKLIKPFFTNKRLELVKNPKVYFIDLGLRNYLISDFRPVEYRNDLGAVMENYAYNMLNNLNITYELKYWRTKSKAEVDFIIEKEQNIYPIEVKYSSKRNIGKSFYSFINKFKPQTGIILTKDYLADETIENSNIKFIPLIYF